MDKINIASALNEKYVPYTYTMLYSLRENHSVSILMPWNADLKLAWQTVQKQFAAIGEGMGVTE